MQEQTMNNLAAPSRLFAGAAGRSVSGRGGRAAGTERGLEAAMALLRLPGLHEIHAEGVADAATGTGFCFGVILATASASGLVWAVHDRAGREIGGPHGPGLNEMGVAPGQVLVVRARDVRTLLGVGEDALRTPGVGVVLLSAWGEDRAYGLTASRRLSMAARTGGKRLFLARAGAAPQPGAAETRWSIRSAPSTPLEGGAPGRPAFSATLLRHRGGATPGTWTMEWDRDRRSFVEPAALSGRLVPLGAERAAEDPPRLRRSA